jgi:hypothetical protein
VDVELPDCRIVSDALWEAARAALERRANVFVPRHRAMSEAEPLTCTSAGYPSQTLMLVTCCLLPARGSRLRRSLADDSRTAGTCSDSMRLRNDRRHLRPKVHGPEPPRQGEVRHAADRAGDGVRPGEGLDRRRGALEAFLRRVAEAGDGAGLPQFVEREFREFLTCGVFEHGVARFRCEGCAREHLVPFSCKGRAWCPSCGGRRMTERAAHLVDAVLPWVPVRQWVLTVPYRLRYQMAWNHGLSRAVLRVYTRVLLDVYTRGARARGVPGGRTGSVTVVQRAGSGLNVNLYFHTLVLDGVFAEDPGGALAFHPAPGPSDAEVAAALATIRHRVQRLLVRGGLEPADEATGAFCPTCGAPVATGRLLAWINANPANTQMSNVTTPRIELETLPPLPP